MSQSHLAPDYSVAAPSISSAQLDVAVPPVDVMGRTSSREHSQAMPLSSVGVPYQPLKDSPAGPAFATSSRTLSCTIPNELGLTGLPS